MKQPRRLFSQHRLWTIIIILTIVVLLIIGRIFYLDTADRHFLVDHSIRESVHYHHIESFRGIIFSRNGIPLAISAPVDNIIFAPKTMREHASLKQLHALSKQPEIGLPIFKIQHIIKQHPHSLYYVVQRNVPPYLADKVKALGVPGVYVEQSWQSYYPLGPAAAQLIGFTNISNKGQDGLELSFNKHLKGLPGLETVITNAMGQILHIKQVKHAAHQGHNVVLSIDSRIQSFAYDALKNEAAKVGPISASAVVLDPRTGEILAAVSYPSFNPNAFSGRSGSQVRDRAMTDTFEPGSTIKVLTIARALESGKYQPDSLINTNPGYYYIHGNRIRDDANFGIITLTGILTKSSNVGVSKVALSLNRQNIYNMFVNAGIGSQPTGLFPGEAAGVLHPFAQMGEFEFATMTFGYAISVSLIQLARVYGAIANFGVLEPLSYLKINKAPPGKRLMSKKTATELIKMLHTVVEPGGTGILANIPGYCVAGKTGTTHQVGPHGFYKNRYNAVFIGLVPCDDPRIVIAVRFNDPRKSHLSGYGGVSAAPVFSQIAERTMQVLGVQPDETHINYQIYRNQKYLLRIIADA